jgi:hypothetical protein
MWLVMKHKSEMSKKKTALLDKRLYTLEVFLIDGPISEKFIKRNPVISRTIEIRGHRTLADLHATIFKAFDREEEHMYEFQIGGKGPQDPKAKRYGLHETIEDSYGKRKLASDTPIGSLNFKVGEPFGYWFDFGDDWWHQINVINIKEEAPVGKYPKVTKREGASPPQYEHLEE